MSAPLSVAEKALDHLDFLSDLHPRFLEALGLCSRATLELQARLLLPQINLLLLRLRPPHPALARASAVAAPVASQEVVAVAVAVTVAVTVTVARPKAKEVKDLAKDGKEESQGL